MAGRGRTSYQKRVKEQARLERRQQKEAKRQARKAAKNEGDLGFAPLTGLEEPPDSPADTVSPFPDDAPSA